MKKKFKKNPFITIGIIVSVLIALVVVIRNTTPNKRIEEVVVTPKKKTEVITLRPPYKEGQKLQFEANVRAENVTAITAESSGKITSIYKEEGDTVKKGDKLFTLNNRDQQIAYQQAVVQLDNQNLALKNLEKEFNNDGASVQRVLTRQQELSVKNSYQSLLNNDLQAYPKSNPEDQKRGGPIINGAYISTIEGQYILETYRSASDSGASIRYSGLESGTVNVSTNFPLDLGTRGLQLQFPIDFDKSETWIINIPNTKSSSYVQYLNDYETAKRGKDVKLKQSQVTEEQLSQQRNAVRQQELAVLQASAQLEKTIVRAPFDGDLISFNLTQGAVVSSFSSVGVIKSLGKLELEFSISRKDALYLKEGDVVYRGEKEIGVITYIARSLDDSNYKNIVHVSLGNNIKAIEGETISISVIPNFSSDVFLETSISLTAIKIIGNDPYVGIINKNNSITMTPVQIGLLLGSKIEIISGLEDYQIIVKDVRGYSEGDLVEY